MKNCIDCLYLNETSIGDYCIMNNMICKEVDKSKCKGENQKSN
jgi:hypothetical protein